MRSDVLRVIVAFLVPYMVLVLVFTLLGLTSIGYQAIAYGSGIAGFAWVISQTTPREHR